MTVAQGGMVALLFTDLVGSTEILVTLGDDAGERLHRAYLDLLRARVTEWRGREVNLPERRAANG